MKSYEDSYGGSYTSAKEAWESWETGCGEMRYENEPGYGTCEKHSLCEFCRDEVDKIMIDVAKEHEAELTEWLDAKEQFIAAAVQHFDVDAGELHELISENKRHNGGLSRAISGGVSDPEEIAHILNMLDISHSRHADTDYDDLLKDGISRDLARQLKS